MTTRKHVTFELHEMQNMGLRVPEAAFDAVARIDDSDLASCDSVRMADLAIALALA